eukprot:scaffold39992_cov204-Skeletonema_marinoi.AAC.2
MEWVNQRVSEVDRPVRDIIEEKRQLSTSQKADDALETSRTHYTSNTTTQHLLFDFLVVVMNSSSSSSQKAAGGR